MSSDFERFRKVVRKLRKHPTKQERSFADSNQLLYNRVEDDQKWTKCKKGEERDVL